MVEEGVMLPGRNVTTRFGSASILLRRLRINDRQNAYYAAAAGRRGAGRVAVIAMGQQARTWRLERERPA